MTASLIPKTPRKPRGFGPTRTKKAKARFRVGDRVTGDHLHRHLPGFPIGERSALQILEVRDIGTKIRYLVAWGGWDGNVSEGWIDDDVLEGYG